jgi:hypothetical protein
VSDEAFENFFSKIKETGRDKITYISNALGANKMKILEMIYNKSVPVKTIFDNLIESNILTDVSRTSFRKWIEINIPLCKIEIEQDSMPLTSEEKAEIILRNDNSNSINNDHINLEENRISIPIKDNIIPVFLSPNDEKDSSSKIEFNAYINEIFYGFRIADALDDEFNKYPKHNDLSKDNMYKLFLSDHDLNNTKIAKILLYSIDDHGENIYQDTWQHLLLQEGESLSKYYDRLTILITIDNNLQRSISLGTKAARDWAASAKYFDLKQIS